MCALCFPISNDGLKKDKDISNGAIYVHYIQIVVYAVIFRIFLVF
jgi:hypothetical protein